MKKVYLFLFMSLFFISLPAQNTEQVRIGIRAGINLSHINFSKGSPPPPSPIETTWDPGINFGVVVIVPLIEDLYFQPEYLYSEMGGEAESLDRIFHFNYLSLPVLLRWEATNKLSLLAGPQVDLAISAEEEFGGERRSIIHDLEQRQLGAVLDVQYEVIQSFSVSFRYMHGLNHVGLQDGTDIQEFKYEMFNFSLVYIF